MKLTRRQLIAATLSAAAGSVLWPFMRAVADPVSRPNILLLLADDWKYNAHDAGTSLTPMPRLNALAESGFSFRNNFVTTSICPASRASIITGQYAKTHGVYNFQKPLKPGALQSTFPVLLRKSGYYTGFIGKWGVGREIPRTEYDFFEGFPGQGKYHSGKGHMTDLQTAQALEFFDGLPSNRPWLLQLSYKAPHDPFQPQDRFAKLFENVEFPHSITDTTKDAEQLPSLLQNSLGRKLYVKEFSSEEKRQHMLRNYYRVLYGMDESVGILLDHLRKKGQLDNTVVIATSDNGLMFGEHGLNGKWCMYEDSIRVPLTICMPGRAPAQIKAMSLNIDLAPTILALAQLPADPGMQGVSLLPLMRSPGVKGRDAFYYEHSFKHGGDIIPCEGIRTERWKYTVYKGVYANEELLFDLNKDPLEEKNLMEEAGYAETLAALRQQMALLSRSLNHG